MARKALVLCSCALSTLLCLSVAALSYRQGGYLSFKSMWPRLLQGCGPLTTPQPRTDWPTWLPFHTILAQEVKVAEAGKGYDLVFYGDSITEEWRGTTVGAVWPYAAPDPAIYQEVFGAYSNKVLAIAGDETAHLQWRLQNGELALVHPAKVAVIMIGTNDFGAASTCRGPAAIQHAVDGTAKRLKGILNYIHEKTPETQIITMALLPRSGWAGQPAKLYDWPNEYTAPMEELKAYQQEWAAAKDHLHFLDCGAIFLPDGKLHTELMEDLLHPSPGGMEMLAQCISPLVKQLMPAASKASLAVQ